MLMVYLPRYIYHRNSPNVGKYTIPFDYLIYADGDPILFSEFDDCGMSTHISSVQVL